MTVSQDRMTIEQPSDHNHMTPEEAAICEKMSAYQKPHSQRAQALLGLDEGLTQAQAAERAGLTKGQVRYWLNKFRKIRLGVFPKELVSEARLAAGLHHPQDSLFRENDAEVAEQEPSAFKSELVPQPAETALVIQADKVKDIVPVDEAQTTEKKDHDTKKKKKKAGKKQKAKKGKKKDKKKGKRKKKSKKTKSVKKNKSKKKSNKRKKKKGKNNGKKKAKKKGKKKK